MDLEKVVLTNRDKLRINQDMIEKGIDTVLQDCYNGMDCTIIYPDGSRPLMTNCYLYKHYCAVVDYISEVAAEDGFDISDAIAKIDERKAANEEFEIEHPPITYKKENSKKSKSGKYTHKDMFTGEVKDDTPKTKRSKTSTIDIDFTPIFNFKKK